MEGTTIVGVQYANSTHTHVLFGYGWIRGTRAPGHIQASTGVSSIGLKWLQY